MHLKREMPFYILLISVLLALSYYFYAYTISLFPSYYHAWTQSDRFALALCYLQTGMNLFKPCTFNLMTIEGVTAVDLPIFEYIIAWFMKTFGSEPPWIFRATTLVYSIIGYIFLFRLSKLIGASTVRSIAIALFAFTCPVLVYYNAGFVPSPYSFASVFIGYYFIFKYLKEANTKHLAWGLFFLTIAALYRTPYNIFLFAVLIQLSLNAIICKTSYRKEVLYFAISYLTIIAYSIYKGMLAEKYGSMFLTELLYPESFAEFQNLLTDIWNTWKYQYFTKAHYLFLGLGALVLAWKLFAFKSWNTLQKQWTLLTALILAGASLYFVLMMQQFPAHDYYFIDSFYPGIIMLFALAVSLIPSRPVWNIAFVIVSVGLLYKGTLQAKAVQDDRYTRQSWDDGETTRHNFEGADVFLDAAGVAKEDRILVLDAYSTNAPLILSKRWGYTVQHTTKENLQNALDDFDYEFVVIQDEYLPHAIIYNYPNLVHHLEPLAHNGKISVYKYTTDSLNQYFYDLLPIDTSASQPIELNFSNSKKSFWSSNYETHQDSIGEQFIKIESTKQFGPAFEQKVSELSGRHILFEMTYVNHSEPTITDIAISATDDVNTNYYKSISMMLHHTSKPKKLRCLFVLPDDLNPEDLVKCFVYNFRGNEITAYGFSVLSY